ncbi:ribokinase [Neobacillus drentensis]|uniref:ribokinase n=1 Tax=Neobacillus drentensis TaxID=220684 RepID=UPI0008263991|nr:ribokinase [Neobacillus drentensis]
MSKVVVIGSLNVDLVTQVPHLPQAGETISSVKFQTNFGGKGANQAFALAKLGAEVAMIGKVGNDEYGRLLIDNLTESGVDTAAIQEDDGPTGMAFINVSSDGENNIVLVSGANHRIQPADIERHRRLLEQCDIIIMQLEIPLEIVEYVLELASEYNKKVILNPAPAQKLSTSLLGKVHTLIPNETELQAITGMPVSTEEEILRAGLFLKSLGIKRVVVTAGEKGSYVVTDVAHYHVPACTVDAVDTTAAGDSFISAFVIASLNGLDDVEAASFASRVSAVVVTREGAQASIPTLEEVENYFGVKPPLS